MWEHGSMDGLKPKWTDIWNGGGMYQPNWEVSFHGQVAFPSFLPDVCPSRKYCAPISDGLNATTVAPTLPLPCWYCWERWCVQGVRWIRRMVWVQRIARWCCMSPFFSVVIILDDTLLAPAAGGRSWLEWACSLFLFIGRNVVVALPCKEYTACLVVEWHLSSGMESLQLGSEGAWRTTNFEEWGGGAFTPCGRCDMMTDDSSPLGKPNATFRFRLGYRSVWFRTVSWR